MRRGRSTSLVMSGTSFTPMEENWTLGLSVSCSLVNVPGKWQPSSSTLRAWHSWTAGVCTWAMIRTGASAWSRLALSPRPTAHLHRHLLRTLWITGTSQSLRRFLGLRWICSRAYHLPVGARCRSPRRFRPHLRPRHHGRRLTKQLTLLAQLQQFPVPLHSRRVTMQLTLLAQRLRLPATWESLRFCKQLTLLARRPPPSALHRCRLLWKLTARRLLPAAPQFGRSLKQLTLLPQRPRPPSPHQSSRRAKQLTVLLQGCSNEWALSCSWTCSTTHHIESPKLA